MHRCTIPVSLSGFRFSGIQPARSAALAAATAAASGRHSESPIAYARLHRDNVAVS